MSLCKFLETNSSNVANLRFTLLLANGAFCRLIIILADSFDPDQAPMLQNIFMLNSTEHAHKCKIQQLLVLYNIYQHDIYNI